jgi:hypothetical protein
MDNSRLIHGQPTEAPNPANQTLPIEVMVMTLDYEIRGFVHVARASREERRISDLLNAPEKRFLAITNAQLIHRHTPSSPRHYSFIQVHVDSVQMVHPSAQALLGQTRYDNSNAEAKLNSLKARIAG